MNKTLFALGLLIAVTAAVDECDRVGSRSGDWNIGDRVDSCIGQVKYQTDPLTQIRQQEKGREIPNGKMA